MRFLTALGLAFLLGCGSGGETSKEDRPLLVFAAASLRELVEEAAQTFGEAEDLEMALNFAGSNTLAEQILAAPRADVFLSADNRWIDRVEAGDRTVEGSRRDVFSNRLVVVAHRDAPFEMTRLEDLAGLPFRHLALAQPDAVPAGRYARAYLEQAPHEGADLWQKVAGKVAPTLDVRAALALVETDPRILGIVYRSDLRASKTARLLFEIPAHPEIPIVYGAAVVRGGQQPEAGHRFLEFLSGPHGQDMAQRHGLLPALPKDDGIQ